MMVKQEAAVKRELFMKESPQSSSGKLKNIKYESFHSIIQNMNANQKIYAVVTPVANHWD